MAGLPRVLLTGFAPFGGESINPAQELLHELSGERIAGHRVEPLLLPVSFEAAPQLLCNTIDALSPSLVLCLGQATGRARISIERIAINLADARIDDNEGARPLDATLVEQGPAAYFSTLPVKAMLAALHQHAVPAELSMSAGTYVCNAVFYRLMHHLALHHPETRGGFIHVPLLPQQAVRFADAPSMSLETLAKGIGIALGAALETTTDLALPGGLVC
jgi:pyroglutamyl-peptidase